MYAAYQSGDALTAAVKFLFADNPGAALSELIIGKSHCLASMVGYPPSKFPHPQCGVTRSVRRHAIC
jgi:hypothetical protein